MPIPKLTGKMTPEEITDAYKGMGWAKTIVFDWITVDRHKKIYKVTYEFISAALPCDTKPECSYYRLTFVEFRPTGVMKTCAICRRTEGPITLDLGRVIGRKEVEPIDAWEIIYSTGQRPPTGLEPISGTEGLQIV